MLVFLCLNLLVQNAWAGWVLSQGYHYVCTFPYFTLKILHQQMLYTFRTGQRSDNPIWRITELHQITPIWLCLCHILTSAAASWVLRAMDKHAASDLISLFNSFSPGFQILNLSRRIQKKFLLNGFNSVEVILLACAEAHVGPGSFSNVCIGFPNVYPSFLPSKHWRHSALKH